MLDLLTCGVLLSSGVGTELEGWVGMEQHRVGVGLGWGEERRAFCSQVLVQGQEVVLVHVHVHVHVHVLVHSLVQGLLGGLLRHLLLS